MKHIYLFTEKNLSTEYGRGTYIRQMIKCLHGIENISLNIVQFFTEEKKLKVIKESNNLRIYSFPFQTVQNFELLKYYRNCWYILKKYIYTDKGDILIFHLNFIREHFLIKYMKADYPNCKTIFTIHFQQWTSILLGNLSYYKRIINNSNSMSNNIEMDVYHNYNEEQIIFEKVDIIICLSKFTEQLLVDIYHTPLKKIKLIRNALIDECNIICEEEKKALKRKLFISENEKIILFVGRLDRIKGLDILIEAFKEVLKLYRDCRLIIAGDGDFPTYMKEVNGYWNKIIFTGRLEKKELHQFYQIADIGVLPSFHEQCSYVAIEMMGFGLPVINSSANGLNEMISDYEGRKTVNIVENENKMVISPLEISEYIVEYFQKKTFNKMKIPNIFLLENVRNDYLSLYAGE
jgi:glycosyltransferase